MIPPGIRREARRPEQLGLFLLLGAYLAARLVIITRGEVFTAYDTFSYARRDDPAFDRGPLVSLTGHAPRLWGVPLFYAAFPDDFTRALAQWMIGTLAWGSLAWVLASLLRSSIGKLAGAGGVLFLATLEQVGNLDLAILSESLTINLGVLTLAMLLRWFATGSRTALVLLILAAFWWTFTRPDIRVFTVVLLVVLAACAWRLPRRRTAAATAAAILALGIAWCSAITPVASAHFGEWGSLGTNQAEELFISRLRIDVFPNPAVKQVFSERLGMPSCPGADAAAAQAEWDLVEFADAYRACPELVAWSQSNMDGAFLRFALAAPAEYARMTVDLTGLSLTGGTYATVPAIIPAPVARLAFPGLPWTLPATFGLLALALGAALTLGGWRSHRLLVATSCAAAAACTLSVVAGVVAVGGHWRFGIQEAVGLRLAIIMLAAVAVDAALRRRGTGDDGSKGAASPATEPGTVAVTPD